MTVAVAEVALYEILMVKFAVADLEEDWKENCDEMVYSNWPWLVVDETLEGSLMK